MKSDLSKIITLSAVFLNMLFFSCKEGNQKIASAEENYGNKKQGLKDYYQDYFPVGVAVSPQSLKGASKELILEQFNSLTAENVMKLGVIHPEEDRYNWGPADKIVAFAEENGFKMRGHNLVWHQQTGDWIFKSDQGDKVDLKTLKQRLQAHTDSVVGRYKDLIYAWDVVNEAVADDSTKILRDSPWLEIMGEDYIAQAFEYAHKADPDAKLFYNDYNAIIPQKRDRIYKMLKNLVDQNVPIDGMGIQGHWSIYSPSEEELRKALDLYASLGLELQITELDISIYPWEKENRKLRDGESDDFTPELEQKQLERYEMFFRVFRDYKDVLTGVTFWNVSDKYSWLDHYPVEGRKNYPLLFDEDYEPKKAYDAVTDFEKETD